MQGRSPASGTPGTRLPLGAAKLPSAPRPPRTTPAVKPSVDKFPRHPAEWKAFADLPADERSAIYLRSIRAMMLFFTVLTVIGLAVTTVLLLIGLFSTNDAATVPTYPFG